MLDAYPEKVELSLRQRYVMAQALVLGIEKLGEVEPSYRREYSNMADMGELLKSPAFAPFAVTILESLSATGKPATTAATLVYYEEPVEDLPF